MSEKNNVGCSLGCLPLIITIFVLWALLFTLPTPWGNLEIDLFSPAIRLEK